MAKRNLFGYRHGYFNELPCFAVFGEGIDRTFDADLFTFASPHLAERMCAVLMNVYRAGKDAARLSIAHAAGMPAVADTVTGNGVLSRELKRLRRAAAAAPPASERAKAARLRAEEVARRAEIKRQRMKREEIEAMKRAEAAAAVVVAMMPRDE